MRGYPSRLSLLGMRGRLSTDSPSGRDTGDPTERGAYHDILLCCQTEKCLLRMRDGVCSDVSGAAFNCGVPGERERKTGRAKALQTRASRRIAQLAAAVVVVAGCVCASDCFTN